MAPKKKIEISGGRSSIPDAPYYVTSTDTFMSGWGGAQGKTNRVVVPAKTRKEAERIAAYAKARGDQSRVNITQSKPTGRAGVIYSVVSGWVKTSLDWSRKRNWKAGRR